MTQPDTEMPLRDCPTSAHPHADEIAALQETLDRLRAMASEAGGPSPIARHPIGDHARCALDDLEYALSLSADQGGAARLIQALAATIIQENLHGRA